MMPYSDTVQRRMEVLDANHDGARVALDDPRLSDPHLDAP
jgi:hypothetical protein